MKFKIIKFISQYLHLLFPYENRDFTKSREI